MMTCEGSLHKLDYNRYCTCDTVVFPINMHSDNAVSRLLVVASIIVDVLHWICLWSLLQSRTPQKADSARTINGCAHVYCCCK